MGQWKNQDKVEEIIYDHWNPPFPIHSKRLMSTESGISSDIILINEKYILKLPKTLRSKAHLAREAKILEQLRYAKVPLVPHYIASGEISDDSPFSWLVYRYIKGNVNFVPPCSESFVPKLVLFLKELHRTPSPKKILPNESTYFRGANMRERDSKTNELIQGARLGISQAIAENIWREALAADGHEFANNLIHGDLHPGNIVFLNGKLCGVLDFGCVSSGDRSCDLMAGWTLLSGDDRKNFFSEMETTDQEYYKSKGWALTFALGAVQDFPDLPMGRIGLQTLRRVLAAVD